MHDYRNNSNRSRRLGCLLPAAAAVLLAIGGAAAQETEGQAPPESQGRQRMVAGTAPGAKISLATSQPSDARKTINVIALKYTNANTLAKSLSVLMEKTSCRIVADGRGNSLIVSALADDLDKLLKLIEQLDVPPAAVQQSVIQTYRIQNRPADANLQNLLNEAFGRGFGPGFSTTTIVTDPPRGLVIVAGDEQNQKVVRQLLEELDQPVRASKPAGVNMRVRIVWLMAGPKTDALPATPADLKDVVEELDRIGITQPRMAAQIVIQTSSQDNFEMSAPVALPEPCVLRITGSCSEWFADKPTLNFKIGAGAGAAQPSPTPCTSDLWQIKTTISVPVDHAVVLGVSPTGNTTSAFVVQVSLK